MSKTERQSEVDALTAELKASPNVFVTDFSGLNVLKMTDFRRRLRAAGAKYVVVKNTLAQRALAAHSIAELDEHLAGATGFVFAGSDPMAAAKVLGEFVKEHERPTVKAGWLDGRAVAPAYVKRLGEIPRGRCCSASLPARSTGSSIRWLVPFRRSTNSVRPIRPSNIRR